jgi:Sap, sulfolipid-1-addressing protein
VIAQAAGLAVLAAISPTALLLAAVYLGSARPRATILSYLAGAVVMSIAIGIVILVALRAGGFSLPHHRHDRYGLRLGLGILLVLAGLVVFRRKPKPVDPDKPQKGIVGRLMANPAPYTAFLAGLLVFGPGVTFIAAVQVVATANAGLSETTAALIVVVVINVALVWLPLVAYLAAPDFTSRTLIAFNAWLRSHGRIILAGVLVIAGIILTVNGITGLIQKG